jgi:hypothetical protein
MIMAVLSTEAHRLAHYVKKAERGNDSNQEKAQGTKESPPESVKRTHIDRFYGLLGRCFTHHEGPKDHAVPTWYRGSLGPPEMVWLPSSRS